MYKKYKRTNQIIRANGKVWTATLIVTMQNSKSVVTASRVNGCVNSPEDLEEAIQNWMMDNKFF